MRREATSAQPSCAGTVYTSSVTDLSEGVVASRVPSLTDERLRVLSRRHPVTVPPGTSLADCLRAIQRTGTGDSVFVCDPDGLLRGVLTERDIFARLVGGHVDLSQPVESLMTTEPRTLDLDKTIRDAIELPLSREELFQRFRCPGSGSRSLSIRRGGCCGGASIRCRWLAFFLPAASQEQCGQANAQANQRVLQHPGLPVRN
jgi:CBS domain-containing protein